MRRTLSWVVSAVAFWGTLKLADVPAFVGHDVCGPWGCGPPTNALLACHLGWCVLLSPLIPFARRVASTRPKQVRFSGYVIAIVGSIGVLAVGAHEYLTWLPQASEFARGFFWQRWAFAVAIMTDVPLVQLVLLGISFVLTAAVVRQRFVLERTRVREGHDSIAVPSFPKLDSSKH